MKHVSWIFAAVIGLAIGFFARGALEGRPATVGVRPQPAPAARAPQRPVEDTRAVYKVPVDDSAVKGPADALVTVVESSDFECPFCKRAAPTVKQIEDTYGGKVRIVFKHNPLPMHPNAWPAALAAEEARAQGGDAKFWAMAEKLFAAQPLDATSIERAAQELGLDAAKVKDAIATRKYASRIERDQRLMQGLGAGGTPSFFVNGRKIVGAQPFEAFRTVIDEELHKAEALVRSGTPAGEVYARIIERGATSTVYLPGTAPGAQAAAPGQPPAAPPAPAAPPPSQYRKVTLRPDDPARGAKDAKVTVVVFSDFQCPFCGRVEPTLKELEAAYPGQLRIVWKHEPLPMHPNAMPAALAAEAAREQGKFWPMHDKLFSNQQNLSPEVYEQYARELGLDLKKFKDAMARPSTAARVAEDQKLAAAVGANGTPNLFFNCRQVVGAQPLDRMKSVVDDELRKVDALLKGGKPDARTYDRACDANVTLAAAGPQVTIRPDDPIRGNPRAPVTLVVFSDFQCPFCARVEPTLAQVQQAYGDRVRIVWKHQPLPFHPNAMPAAEAAEAAREQGKFWQMHDKLFSNQQALSAETYDRYARELGLDLGKFKASLQAGKARARISEDQQLGASIGANGTPTMFVNGEKVEGAVPFDTLKAVIDRKLSAAR